MPTSSSSVPRPSVGIGAHAPDDRAWFLQESSWEDPTWVFAPTNALEERHPVRLRWDFTVQDGRRFTDGRYAALLQTSRQLISLIRTRSLCTGLPLRPSSVLNYFLTLRLLVRWMDQEGIVRFADLDAPALLQFQHWLAQLPMARRSTRSASTMQRHLYLFTYLYRFRARPGRWLAGRSIPRRQPPPGCRRPRGAAPPLALHPGPRGGHLASGRRRHRDP